MKVKEVIEQLKKYNDLDDEIISVYWTHNDVCEELDEEVKQEHWLDLVSMFDYGKCDFRQTIDDMRYILDEIREEGER